MSTRSGKRLHNSFHENTLIPDQERIVNSERKTRSRCLKENIEHVIVNTDKKKKPRNYVSYPHEQDSEVCADTAGSQESEDKAKRKSTRKNALKDSNTISSTDSTEPIIELKKPIRTTRRTRKFSENILEDTLKADVEEVPIDSVKSRKGKKQKKVVDNTELLIEDHVSQKQNKNDNDTELTKEHHVSKKQKKLVIDDTDLIKQERVSKKKLKKKKAKRSGSIIVEEFEQNTVAIPDLSKNNTSNDSFHSAAGSIAEDIACASPPNMVRLPDKNSELLNNTLVPELQDIDKNGRRKTRSFTRMSPNTPNKSVNISRKRKSSTRDIDEVTVQETCNKTIENSSKKSRSSISAKLSIEPINTSQDNEVKNTTFDMEGRKSIKNTTFDKSASENINTTYNKDDSKLETRKSVQDITPDKYSISNNDNRDRKNDSLVIKKEERKSIINTTYEKANNSIQESSVADETAECHTEHEKYVDSNEDADQKTIQNYTCDAVDNSLEICESKELDKSRKSISHKSPNSDLNSTFDKNQSDSADALEHESNVDRDKLNTTFEKQSKSSLLSSDNSNITLDKLDVSRISITSDESKEMLNTTPYLIESSLDESVMRVKESPVKAPMTPLKREGTFTKDSEVVESPKPKTPIQSRTPIRSLSVSSPGCTPFPVSKSGSKERLLNVTRSIEKRRSSLTEPLPRVTKVMFCSPVNNPVVVMQQTRKVVKSSLKGSNKSFVFDETLSERRAAPRKRSHTQGEADDARVKRSRPADGHHSVERTRHRTTSANAKLAVPVTPSKKTPSKSNARVSRTKLPNFAALHQKQFDKMESLDECQERKAKRAKLLLTPTGGVNVLDRTSPKDLVPEPPKPKTEPKIVKEPKKPETPVKSLPTLKSLNPGYTRFGFKLNLDVNPFSGPSKEMSRTEGNIFSFSTQKSKPKVFQFSANQQKNQPAKLTRQTTLPSLEGTTSARREMAKKAVLEKTLVDKRVVKRNESRNENRTVIKGVRTNRRFELQMRMRNFD